MKILHTADWHVGKKLGRFDRSTECEGVLDELVAITRDQQADVVIVAGDLFDRGLPPFIPLRLVLETLVRLADTGARVVAIPGNHDSPELFEVLEPHLSHSGVTLVPRVLRPESGGVFTVPGRDGRSSARIACFPFLHEARVIDLMEEHDALHKSYAERVRSICRAYSEHMTAHPDKDAVDILVGHFMIHGAIPSGSERELHIGEAYAATTDAVPAGVHYAALGHIHQAQPAPGSEDHARYSGSLMQLDFSEAEQDKSVVVVDITPQGRRRIEQIPITSGRRLVKVRDTLDNLRVRVDELAGAILSVDVITDGPDPGLTDVVREFLPDALHVRADYPRDDVALPQREGMGLSELYAEFVKHRYGQPPSDELLAAFGELVKSVGATL